jgi:hypothetical protein
LGFLSGQAEAFQKEFGEQAKAVQEALKQETEAFQDDYTAKLQAFQDEFGRELQTFQAEFAGQAKAAKASFSEIVQKDLSEFANTPPAAAGQPAVAPAAEITAADDEAQPRLPPVTPGIPGSFERRRPERQRPEHRRPAR